MTQEINKILSWKAEVEFKVIAKKKEAKILNSKLKVNAIIF